MASIRLEWTGEWTSYNFSLEGEEPRGLETGTSILPGLGWSVRLDQDDRVSLSSGERLRDLKGAVHLFIGSAEARGRESFKFPDGTRLSWGALSYVKFKEDTNGCYDIRLYVSRVIFDRVEKMMLSGRPPRLNLTLGDRLVDLGTGEHAGSPAFKSNFGDEIDWDNKAAPWIEIDWCEFEWFDRRRTDPNEEGEENRDRPVTIEDLDRVTKELKRQATVGAWLLFGAVVVFLVFR
jgi:hypothetical protein